MSPAEHKNASPAPAPIDKEAESATIGRSRKATEALEQHNAARAEYDRWAALAFPWPGL